MPKPRNWKPTTYKGTKDTVIDFERLGEAMKIARLKMGRDAKGRTIRGRYGRRGDGYRSAAQGARIGASTWHRVETGTLRPSANTYAKVCLFLDVSLDRFLVPQ